MLVLIFSLQYSQTQRVLQQNSKENMNRGSRACTHMQKKNIIAHSIKKRLIHISHTGDIFIITSVYYRQPLIQPYIKFSCLTLEHIFALSPPRAFLT